jgi:hypothetical protein
MRFEAKQLQAAASHACSLHCRVSLMSIFAQHSMCLEKLRQRIFMLSLIVMTTPITTCVCCGSVLVDHQSCPRDALAADLCCLHAPTHMYQTTENTSEQPSLLPCLSHTPAHEAWTSHNSSPPIFLSTPNTPFFKHGPQQKRGHTHCWIHGWRNTFVNDLVIVIVLEFVIVLVSVFVHGDGVCDRDCAGDRAGVL